MYVKKEVLSVVTCFPLQGNNRWGELIFSYNAKRKGFNTVVLGHYFKHLAISSKQKNSIKKSSISYLVEKQLWDCVEKELLSDVQVTKIHNTNLDNNLRHLLESSAPLLLYGCGKNTSILFKHLCHVVNVLIVVGHVNYIVVKIVVYSTLILFSYLSLDFLSINCN